MVNSNDSNNKIFTNDIRSNLASADYRTFSHSGSLKKISEDFLWLYYNAPDEGCKCRICEIFPPLSTDGGHSRDKFDSEAV